MLKQINRYIDTLIGTVIGYVIEKPCLFINKAHTGCLLFLLGSAITPMLFAQDDTGANTTPNTIPVATIYGDLLATENMPVVMRDETVISLDIYRPADNTPHATLYAAGPYPHTRDILADRQTLVGPIAWYVNQGYAVVVANVRGTGNSGGDFSFFDRDEQQDHYEIIEWIAQQDWSDGQVAGTGAGYYAASQWQMAIQNPPHLACIAPINGTTDPFRDWVSPGGLANNSYINEWYDRQIRQANAYMPGVNRLINYDLRLAQLTHPGFDDYWRIRDSLNSVRLINVPVFALNDWSLSPIQAGISSTVKALAGLNSTNKLLVANPGSDMPLYQDTDYLSRELLPFYQWCFTGKNAASPFIAQPRIRYMVRGQNTIKRESTWPPGNITQQSWFLNNAPDNNEVGILDQSHQAGNPGFSAYERRDKDAELTFISAPLERDLDITGPIMLELYTSSSARDMALEVTLKEEVIYPTLAVNPVQPSILTPTTPVPAQPVRASTFITVTRGSLKASARLRDAGLGSEFNPVYSMTGKQELVPGQVYRQDIALRQTAYHFTAGNRLVLEITPFNDGSLTDRSGRDTLQHNSQYPSRLWMPVVRAPATGSPQSAPPPPSVRSDTTINMEVPDIRLLTPETLDALNGDEKNPIIFVPR